MSKLQILLPIALGAVVINTMPMWLAVLASGPNHSQTLAGGLGSCVLLAAAMACAFRLPYLTLVMARIVVPLAFAVLAADVDKHPVVLLVTCLVLGLALGALTQNALVRMPTGNVLQGLGTALAIGLFVYLFVYLALPVIQLSPLWVLCALSLTLFSVRLDSREANLISGSGLSGLPLGYLPFFALMGAYWSFIEIYATSLGDNGSVVNWLLGSLLASAAASALSARIPPSLRQPVGHFALGAAALTGAASYWVVTPIVLGASIVANGFFLFLYFPLYLSSQEGHATDAMALYLLGFALGGLLGAAIIGIGGYTALALAILISPLAVWVGRPFRAAG